MKGTSSRAPEPPAIAPGRYPSFPLPLPIPYPPMEAKRASSIPKGQGWQYEPKWDGFRAIVFRSGDEVFIQSKASQPLTRYFPDLVEAFLKLDSRSFVLDGEIVVPVRGQLSFDDLLLRIHPAEKRVRQLAHSTPAEYYAFDLLAVGGRGGVKSLAGLPLEQRRAKLEEFFARVPEDASVRLSPATTDARLAEKWFREFRKRGLDGVMAKRLDEPYRTGEREGMVKVKKLKTADCVVGGFRWASKGGEVGSLLLGLYDDEGRLNYVGHASSFSTKERETLKPIVEKLHGEHQFEVRVPGGPSRWATERTGEWEPLKPQLVCEVEYDYFSQGRFRHGAKFLRWRPEKKPRQCTMEQVL